MNWEQVIGVPLLTTADIRKWVPSYFHVSCYLAPDFQPRQETFIILIVSPEGNVVRTAVDREKLKHAPMRAVEMEIKEALNMLLEEDAKNVRNRC